MKPLFVAGLVLFFAHAGWADYPGGPLKKEEGTTLFTGEKEKVCGEIVGWACHEGYAKCIQRCHSSDCDSACLHGMRACEHSVRTWNLP